MGPIVVHEGENVRLHCSATGTPTPRITWQKLDNRPINRGAWQGINKLIIEIYHLKTEEL